MNHSIADLFKDSLQRQLVYFEENGQDILNGFERAAERAVIRDLVTRYCRLIERQVSDLESEGPETLVWIGSTVTVYNETDREEESFTIVLPEDVNPDEGKISFLSPIGQKLLLARTGSRMEIDSPGGKYWVTVKGVEFISSS